MSNVVVVVDAHADPEISSLTSSASAPLHLEEHRERFQERALRDVTVNSNDPAMLLEPNNPLLVGEEMAAQKVRYVFPMWMRDREKQMTSRAIYADRC